MNVDDDLFEGWEVQGSRASSSPAARRSMRTGKVVSEPGRAAGS